MIIHHASQEEKFYIVITVDMNDADYAISFNVITKSRLEIIMPLIDMIRNFKPYTVIAKDMRWTHKHNYPYSYCCRDDLGEKTVEDLYNVDEEVLDDFEDLLPHCPDDFHTIKSIKLIPYVEGIDLI